MVIKKLAIRNKIRFTRVPYEPNIVSSLICILGSCVYYNPSTSSSKVCRTVCKNIYQISNLKRTGHFGYVVKEKDRPE